MWWFALVVLVLLIVLLHLAFPKIYHSPSTEWKMYKIPGPPRIPYFGNAHQFNMKPEEFIDVIVKFNETYKPIYKFDFLGIFHVIVTDLDDVKIIMNSPEHITKSDDYILLLPWLGTGLLTSTGEKWHNHRKWLTSAFHFKILDQYIDTINKNARILVEKLMSHVDDKCVNINPLMALCTLDIICETAMGVAVNAQKGGEKEYVKATLRMSQLHHIRMFSPWMFTDWVYDLSPTGREQKKVLKTLHGFTERVISERKEAYRLKKEKGQIEEITDLELGQKEKKSFLDLLIEISETGNKLTQMDIREEVDTFMFEGHDTTSAAFSWALHLLGSNPECQEKAYQELKEIFGDSDRDPTHADLAEMKYLERVIKETLRLYPSVPFISRKLEVYCKIKDYVIPAGANVCVYIYCIHRDPKYYPDPLKFDPDRFLPEAMQGRHPFSYIPFSAGPRNCIGQRFAMMEEKVILSQILRKFKVTSLDRPEDINTMAELILRPKDSLRCAFTPRQ